jgi:hypothetical protein
MPQVTRPDRVEVAEQGQVLVVMTVGRGRQAVLRAWRRIALLC